VPVDELPELQQFFWTAKFRNGLVSEMRSSSSIRLIKFGGPANNADQNKWLADSVKRVKDHPRWIAWVKSDHSAQFSRIFPG
jgi:hypothetical protein